MNDFTVKKDIFQFTCIPPAFIKLVIGIGVLLAITAPLIAIYVLMYMPVLKIPAIVAAVLLGVFLFVLKEKWKDHYQFKISSGSLTVQINGKQPPMQFAFSQIDRFTLSLFVDGAGNQASKLSLIDSSSKKVFSIKILNQSEQVLEFLETWQTASSAEMKVLRKNGVLHAVERVGEIIGGFSKSTDIARIDFITPVKVDLSLST